jgi:hypothetical protein
MGYDDYDDGSRDVTFTFAIPEQELISNEPAPSSWPVAGLNSPQGRKASAGAPQGVVWRSFMIRFFRGGPF